MAQGSSGLRLATALLLPFLASASSADNTPRVPTFAMGVEVVSLNLVVTDTGGRQVAGLHADDIELLEDGIPQPISLFAQEEWPVRLQVLLDASGSMEQALPMAKRAARRLLRTLRPGDEAEVAQFNRRLAVLQESTGDVDSLEQAVERVRADGDTAFYNALYLTLKERARARDADELSRRAIVVLTDGEDTASIVDDEQLLDLARRAGVVVYAIGLSPGATPGRPVSSVPTYLLTALARETGGRAHFPRSIQELDGVYEKIASELRTLYGVGYVPLNSRADGGFRRLAVRARHGGLLVRHRSGYFAPGTARLLVGR